MACQNHNLPSFLLHVILSDVPRVSVYTYMHMYVNDVMQYKVHSQRLYSLSIYKIAIF